VTGFFRYQGYHCHFNNIRDLVSGYAALLKKIYVLVATREKKKTSGQMSLMTIALNFFIVHRPRKRGFVATIVENQGENKGSCRLLVNVEFKDVDVNEIVWCELVSSTKKPSNIEDQK
jgi:hypothetical protein